VAGSSRLEISMAANAQTVRLSRTEVMRWFHELHYTNDEVAASIALAVSEAVGNVVRHAYSTDGPGRVDITAELDDEAVVVTVTDAGGGMARRLDTDHNGMGLPLIGRVADGVTVVSDAGGTRLIMRFHLSDGRRRASIFAPVQDRSMALGAR